MRPVSDIDYAIGNFVQGFEDLPDQWAEDALAWREVEAAVGRARLNLPYAEGERRRLDLFYPSGRPEGLVMFIHGGYWQKFDRSYWSHFASGLTARGWAVAFPSYTLAPEARICAITREIARALEKAASLVQGPIRITGHSAGGHLAARMGCRDVVVDTTARDRIERIVPISPVADLRPLLGLSMNQELRLDDAEAAAESPVLHDAPKAAVTVWVGAEERPVFLDQTRWLSEAWGCEMRLAPGRHHFDVIEELFDADSPLVNAILT